MFDETWRWAAAVLANCARKPGRLMRLDGSSRNRLGSVINAAGRRREKLITRWQSSRKGPFSCGSGGTTCRSPFGALLSPKGRAGFQTRALSVREVRFSPCQSLCCAASAPLSDAEALLVALSLFPSTLLSLVLFGRTSGDVVLYQRPSHIHAINLQAVEAIPPDGVLRLHC